MIRFVFQGNDLGVWRSGTVLRMWDQRWGMVEKVVVVIEVEG